MKNLVLALLSVASFSLFANNNHPAPVVKTIKVEESTITWTGKKVTGQHSGTIAIKSGSLTFEEGMLTGGDFVIDMNTIAVTDIAGKSAKSLEGHLKSDDFFGVPNHPTATLKIKDVSRGKKTGNYKINAELTIKGITKTIAFDAKVGFDGASADITINRTDFDVKYGSGSFFDNLGDKMIYDDFDLALSLKY